MEELGQDYGFVLYEHKVTQAMSGLLQPGDRPRDRVIVYVNEARIGVIDSICTFILSSLVIPRSVCSVFYNTYPRPNPPPTPSPGSSFSFSKKHREVALAFLRVADISKTSIR